MTSSVGKSVGYVVAQIPAELTKGLVYTAVGDLGEAVIGYVFDFF